MAPESALWYESLFQVRPLKDKGDVDANIAITGEVTPESLKKQGPQVTLRNAITKGAGFRIIDTDTYIIGLTETSFYWLGNDLRAASTAICLTEVNAADAGVPIAGRQTKSPLISIGFEVPNLEPIVNKLKTETKDTLKWDKYRLKMNTGICARFQETLNNIFLDLTCVKAVVSAEQKKKSLSEAVEKLQSEDIPVATAVEDAKVEDDKSNVEFFEVANKPEDVLMYVIDSRYTRGHGRCLSANSVIVHGGYGRNLRSIENTEMSAVGKSILSGSYNRGRHKSI